MNNNINLYKSAPCPLGVTLIGNRIQFAFAGGRNDSCTLHIFKKGTSQDKACIVMDKSYKTGDVFSCSIDAAVLTGWPKTQYEYIYEINGKYYVDPYALKINGRNRYGQAIKELRGAIVDINDDWKDDNRPDYDSRDLVIYQLHVRGFTKHRSSKVSSKGTYTGLIEKIPYIQSLGINAVMLLPSYEYNEYVNEPTPIGQPEYISYEENDKINYWGYTDDAFYMAPKASYAKNPDNCISEFRAMIKEFHDNNIKVLMDIHFRTDADSGLICATLRHWVINYHIDGFRVNQNVVNEHVIKNDPVLSGILFLGTYWPRTQDNAFISNKSYIPATGCNLADCNDGFLVKIRSFIKGDNNNICDLMSSMSAEGYNCHNIEYINYVADINGFTLADSLSYSMKHNEDNGENNLDGTDYNYSINCGVEGKTRRRKINDIRKQYAINELMLLLLSSGIPMILAGDEFGNSQSGNNNAYCQDNNISWLDWNDESRNSDMVTLVRKAIKTRHDYIQGDRRGYSDKQAGNNKGIPSVSFHGSKPWATESYSYNRAGGMLLSDKGIYIAINMQNDAFSFELPLINDSCIWKPILWSQSKEPKGFVIDANSIVVFSRECVQAKPSYKK